MQKFCEFTIDLETIPKNLLTKKEGPMTVPHYEVNYTVALKIGLASVEFYFEYQGKRYGTVSIKDV